MADRPDWSPGPARGRLARYLAWRGDGPDASDPSGDVCAACGAGERWVDDATGARYVACRLCLAGLDAESGVDHRIGDENPTLPEVAAAWPAFFAAAREAEPRGRGCARCGAAGLAPCAFEPAACWPCAARAVAARHGRDYGRGRALAQLLEGAAAAGLAAEALAVAAGRSPHVAGVLSAAGLAALPDAGAPRLVAAAAALAAGYCPRCRGAAVAALTGSPECPHCRRH